MKVISANVNGLGAATKYGFFDWLVWQNPDIACLQELNVSALPESFLTWAGRANFEVAISPCLGQDNGGVAILSRHGFLDIQTAGGSLQHRGQIVRAKIGDLHVSSVYVTLDNLEEERKALHEIFRDMLTHPDDLSLVCGDFNIIGTDRDADTKYHSKSLGCKPEERAWLAMLLSEWVDVLPSCTQEKRLRTFWVRSKERFEANLGTRIDYQLASSALAKLAIKDSGSVFRDYWHGVRITDHGPITVEYDINILA
ncbi:MAG TPA: exodeoxyribonuclease III [Verrucomicrobiae bacterium]|jgi:exodeoxyribonuclease-3|nr:exodeoxyribonuclease III [Verrucomicrobiae bacterium]